jgi:hypothetical protein
MPVPPRDPSTVRQLYVCAICREAVAETEEKEYDTTWGWCHPACIEEQNLRD